MLIALLCRIKNYLSTLICFFFFLSFSFVRKKSLPPLCPFFSLFFYLFLLLLRVKDSPRKKFVTSLVVANKWGKYKANKFGFRKRDGELCDECFFSFFDFGFFFFMYLCFFNSFIFTIKAFEVKYVLRNHSVELFDSHLTQFLFIHVFIKSYYILFIYYYAIMNWSEVSQRLSSFSRSYFYPLFH